MKTTSIIQTGLFSILGITMLLIVNVCAAQSSSIVRQNTGAAGSSASVNVNGRSYILQQSIGQGSVIGTYTQGAAILRQGFIQPAVRAKTIPPLKPIVAKVYPNPFTDGFNLEFDEELAAGAQLAICDMSGRAVYEVELNAGARMFIPINSISQGVYTLRVLYQGRLFTAHILKQ